MEIMRSFMGDFDSFEKFPTKIQLRNWTGKKCSIVNPREEYIKYYMLWFVFENNIFCQIISP